MREIIQGVNGHPLATERYDANAFTGVTRSDQVAMLKELGLTWYRIDINPAANGIYNGAFKWEGSGGILPLCKAAGINVLPMIYDNIDFAETATNTINYDLGYATGYGFAQAYGSNFTHYELANELELFKKYPAGHIYEGQSRLKKAGGQTNSGQTISDFKLREVEWAAYWIKGANDGVKAAHLALGYPRPKTMTNTAGFLQTALMDKYLEICPDLDIVGDHFYSDQISAFFDSSKNGQAQFEEIRTKGKPKFLYDRWQKPIWFTEANANFYNPASGGTEESNQLKQVKFLKDFFISAQDVPGVEAIIWHELLNDSGNGFGEWYGLVTFPNFTPTALETVKYVGRTKRGLYNAIWAMNKIKNVSVALPDVADVSAIATNLEVTFKELADSADVSVKDVATVVTKIVNLDKEKKFRLHTKFTGWLLTVQIITQDLIFDHDPDLKLTFKPGATGFFDLVVYDKATLTTKTISFDRPKTLEFRKFVYRSNTKGQL